MTFEPNDSDRRMARDDRLSAMTGDDRLSSTGEANASVTPTDADRMRAVPRASSSTGMIGAIVGVIAIVAVAFLVWRGAEGPSTTDTNTGAQANHGAVNTTANPAPATPGAPAIPPASGNAAKQP